MPRGSLYLRDNPQWGVYESKWKVFGEWYHVKQINPVKATVQQLADFLIFLFEEKKLAISSIQGYRSCISKVFLARGINISHDRDLNMLVRNFAIERPVQHRVAPRWDLMIVLRRLMMPPFEPMHMASLADMTRKLAFLLTLASARRYSKTMDPSKPERFRRLLCAFKPGHTGDISKQTVSGWIRQLITNRLTRRFRMRTSLT